MKLRLLFLSLLFTFNAFAQNKLSKSKQASNVTFAYKITDKEVVSLLKDNKVNNDFYHTLVSSDYYRDYKKSDLPYGNYLMVSASGGNLNTSLLSENNVLLQFINNENDFQFYVTDIKGNLIANAFVEIDGKKRAIYDAKAKLYRSKHSKENGKPKEEGIIKVVHEGVSNFFEYDVDDDNYYDDDREDWSFFKKVAYSFPIKYFWQPIKIIFKKKKSTKPLYAGYMVFSKPMYKPIDTVNF
ncbi:MAG: hypothetical protein ABWZ79_05310 [Pedobacter agri]